MKLMQTTTTTKEIASTGYLKMVASLPGSSDRSELIDELAPDCEGALDIPMLLEKVLHESAFPTEELDEIKRSLALGVIRYALSSPVDDARAKRALLVVGVYLHAYLSFEYDRDDAVSNAAIAVIAEWASFQPLARKLVILEFLSCVYERVKGEGGSGDYPRTASSLAIAIISQGMAKDYSDSCNRHFEMELASNGQEDILTWEKRPTGTSITIFKRICERLNVPATVFCYLKAPK
jgi:hypothetical protein